MTIPQFVSNIEFLAALATIIWFLYGPWQNIVLDAVRQILFECRDELFLAAADGKIDFHSPAYKLFRHRFNGAIRVAHELTWIQVLAFAASGAKVQKQESLHAEIAKLENRDVANRMHRLIRRASVAIALGVVLRSPVLMITNVISAPLVGLFLLIDYVGVRERVWKPLRRLVEADLKKLSATA